MRDLSWTFDINLKLHEIYYHITTSDDGLSDEIFENFSDKNYIRYYQHIDSICEQNKCPPPEIIHGDTLRPVILTFCKNNMELTNCVI